MRCELPCEVGSACQVPHPGWMRRELSGEDGYHGGPIFYLCEACGGLLSRAGVGAALESAGHCWEGTHTTLDLPDMDCRRSFAHSAELGNTELTDLHARLAILQLDRRIEYVSNPKCVGCHFQGRSSDPEREGYCKLCFLRLQLWRRGVITFKKDATRGRIE